MSLGVTVGKFYPFHLGHDHLIRSAKAQVDRLVVVVGHHRRQELPGALRAGWIRAQHPDVEVVLADEHGVPEAPEPWAEITLGLLDRPPNVAFTSEDYGAPWAQHMGARHVSVDRAREAFPISGTALRADLGRHWAYLTPPCKAHFARRVRLVGAESTGKTTLAQALAKAFETVWVPEYGRTYWEGRRHLPDAAWGPDEFVRIAAGQLQHERDLAHVANRVVFCDTDPLVTGMWHHRYRGEDLPDLERIRGRYDLTLVLAPDVPWVQDGTRDSAAQRDAMHDWLRARLGEDAVELRGSWTERWERALAAVRSVLRFPPLAAP